MSKWRQDISYHVNIESLVTLEKNQYDNLPFELDMSFGCSGSLLALNPVSLLWFKGFLMSTNLFCFSCISHNELLLFKGLWDVVPQSISNTSWQHQFKIDREKYL